jgi:excisionase family DNA binding protein
VSENVDPVAAEGQGGGDAQPPTKKKRRVPAPTAMLGLVGTKELCRLLGLPVKYVRRLTAEGDLPFERIASRTLYDPERVKKVVRRFAATNKDGREVY